GVRLGRPRGRPGAGDRWRRLSPRPRRLPAGAVRARAHRRGVTLRARRRARLITWGAPTWPPPPPKRSARPGGAVAPLDSPPVSPATRVALAIATVGGAGFAPVAPGTVARALTVLLLRVVPFSRAGLVPFFVFVALRGPSA